MLDIELPSVQPSGLPKQRSPLHEVIAPVSFMISVIICNAQDDDVLTESGGMLVGVFDERNYVPYDYALKPAHTPEQIRRFIGNLVPFFEGLSTEVLVYGFCLFSRLTRVMGKMVMNKWRWRLSLLACFIVAHKLLDDRPYSNATFVRVWKKATSKSAPGPGILLQELNDMELNLLKILDFSVFVSGELYAEVHARLHALYLELAPRTKAGAGKHIMLDDAISNMLLARSPAEPFADARCSSFCKAAPKRSSSCPPQVEV